MIRSRKHELGPLTNIADYSQSRDLKEKYSGYMIFYFHFLKRK